MPIPRAAAVRQQNAQNRAENAERQQAQQAQYPAGRMPAGRPAFQHQARFATTNRMVQRRDRNEDFITAKELEEAMEEHHDSGKGFRRMFLFAIAVFVMIMMLQKYDTEVHLDMPMLDDGSGDGLRFPDATPTKETKEDGGAGATAEISTEELYDILGVDGRIKPQAQAAATETTPDDAQTEEAKREAKARADADKERRRENYRVRQQLKQAYEKHQDGYGQLVSCGRSCEAKHQQVELAYTSLASKVDRELYGVLLDAKDSKSKRLSSKKDLKEAYEKKKEEIQETETEGEDRDMALEELKDAYDILENPEARTYYHLYGAKPPVAMKKTSARAGGWGQDMMLGTYKYRIINAWLDHLGSSYFEIAILLILFGLVLSRIAPAVEQATAIMDAMEDEGRMDQALEAQQRAAAAAAASE